MIVFLSCCTPIYGDPKLHLNIRALAGGGLAMSFEREMNPSQRQQYTGLAKAGTSMAGLRIHGDIQ